MVLEREQFFFFWGMTIPILWWETLAEVKKGLIMNKASFIREQSHSELACKDLPGKMAKSMKPKNEEIIYNWWMQKIGRTYLFIGALYDLFFF